MTSVGVATENAATVGAVTVGVAVVGVAKAGVVAVGVTTTAPPAKHGDAVTGKTQSFQSPSPNSRTNHPRLPLIAYPERPSAAGRIA
jgi:hypothetical protein